MTSAPLQESQAAVLEEVRQDGVGVMRGVFGADAVASARETVLDNVSMMKNTRPTPSSRHLAGFHRYPRLEHLHLMMSRHPLVLAWVEELCGPNARSIGLSDITVNRSQPWHKDLLRGHFSRYLAAEDVCSRWNGTVFKFLLYLQPSSSLQYVAGSHKEDVPLSSDEYAVPGPDADVRRVHVDAGDLVIMDVCTTHRGADEQAFQSKLVAREPRVLISTVFGAGQSPLTDQLELGNAVRLEDWMRRHA